VFAVTIPFSEGDQTLYLTEIIEPDPRKSQKATRRRLRFERNRKLRFARSFYRRLELSNVPEWWNIIR
jgi:hypothetical protein